MADTDCSNCIDPCKFQEHDFYDCYLKTIEALQQAMTEEDIKLFEKVAKRSDELYEETYDSYFAEIRHNIYVLLEAYNEKL